MSTVCLTTRWRSDIFLLSEKGRLKFLFAFVDLMRVIKEVSQVCMRRQP